MRRRDPRVTQLGAGSSRGRDFSALERAGAPQTPRVAQEATGAGSGAPEATSAGFEGVQRLVLEDFPDPKIARTLSPNGRAHWATRVGAKSAVRHAVWIALGRRGGVLERTPPPVRITYRWVVPDRRKRDQDNHSTGVVKVIQDFLVECGYLVADDAEALTSRVAIVYERGRRALEIEIEARSEGC